MNSKTLAIAAVLPALLAAPAHSQNMVTKPIRVQAYVDLGQVVKGSYEDAVGSPNTVDFENYFLSNIGVSMLAETVVDEKLHLNVGVGGLFWYPFMLLSSSPAPENRRIWFGPGVSEASFQYDFREDLFLKFGFFGYKYNPDARNLGEYLLRSQPYPSLVKTGGWSVINSAAYQSLGMQVRWNTFGGAWTHDFLMFSEFEEAPIFDLSPSYVSTLRLGNVLELGAGVTFHHAIAIKPSELRPNYPENIYVEIENMPVSLPDTVYLFGQPFRRQTAVAAGGTLRGTEQNILNYMDTSGNQIELRTDAAGNPVYVLGNDTLTTRTRKRLTYQGIKLMGRASLDPKPLLGLEGLFDPRELKIYGEVAVLGVEDQPYFYDNVFHRMPVMLGINLPTFGLLDAVSVETEYYRNPWADNRRNAFENILPIWWIQESDHPADFDAQIARNHDEDDWKWSVLATKTLTKGLVMHAQVANDHLRLRNNFIQPTFLPVTNETSHWYYLVRLQWGI